jgi:hypothetical protein
VVAVAVDLDDQASLTPDEVDFDALDDLVALRVREVVPVAEREGSGAPARCG